MADILIRNMKMPEEGFVEILIRDDGTVQQTGQSYRIDGTDYYTPYVGETPKMFTAIPIPPHGRLIDENDIKEWFDEWYDPKADLRVWQFFSELENVPTIAEAEE